MSTNESVTPRGLAAHLKDAAWLGARARNAIRRPAFIALVAASVTVLAVISIALAPRHRRRVGPAPPAPAPQEDTTILLEALRRAQIRATNAETELAQTRERVIAAAAAPRRDVIDPATLHRHA